MWNVKRAVAANLVSSSRRDVRPVRSAAKPATVKGGRRGSVLIVTLSYHRSFHIAKQERTQHHMTLSLLSQQQQQQRGPGDGAVLSLLGLLNTTATDRRLAHFNQQARLPCNFPGKSDAEKFMLDKSSRIDVEEKSCARLSAARGARGRVDACWACAVSQPLLACCLLAAEGGGIAAAAAAAATREPVSDGRAPTEVATRS